MGQNSEKWGILLWIFAKRREIGGVYCSVIGHRLRVGATSKKGKAHEWCNECGSGWKCGKGDSEMEFEPATLASDLREKDGNASGTTT